VAKSFGAKLKRKRSSRFTEIFCRPLVSSWLAKNLAELTNNLAELEKNLAELAKKLAELTKNLAQLAEEPTP
jgi:uncharacterized protein YceH (UPF0502 family)